MKPVFLWLMLSTPFAVLAQTVRTVSNNPNNLAQFNTIQAAIDASSSGDTIYVHGSPNVYAGFTINNKRLTIIGPGYTPQSSTALTATVQNSLSFNQALITGVGSNGTEIQGLVITGSQIPLNVSPVPSNLIFRRNRFLTGFSMFTGNPDGYIFESNEFLDAGINTSAGAGTANCTNWLITNNLFGSLSAPHFGFFLADNIVIDHNIFYLRSAGQPTAIFTTGAITIEGSNDSRNVTLTNNIFVRRNASWFLRNSRFSNNITFNTSDNTPWLTATNVDGGGNIANQDPQMFDQSVVNTGTAVTALTNFRVQNGSPAKGSGTGGKDMGLRYDETGVLNWANGRNSRLPRISSMSVINPIVNTGGTIQVQVQARRGQ